MTVALTTKLDAVNKMLEGVWIAPVSTLEVSGVASVAQAKRVLEETARSVQTGGWAFNIEEGLTLTPDTDGFVYIPANTLQVDPWGDSQDVDAVQRGTRLYDRKNHTYVFPRPVVVRVVLLLEFEELPESARTYIAVMAARVFRDKYLQNDSPSAISPEEAEALRNLMEAEGQSGDHNVFSGSYSVANILQRE